MEPKPAPAQKQPFKDRSLEIYSKAIRKTSNDRYRRWMAGHHIYVKRPDPPTRTWHRIHRRSQTIRAAKAHALRCASTRTRKLLQKAKETAFYQFQNDLYKKEPPAVEAMDDEPEEVVDMEQFFQEFEAWSKNDMNIYDKLRQIDIQPLLLDEDDPEYVEECLKDGEDTWFKTHFRK